MLHFAQKQFKIWGSSFDHEMLEQAELAAVVALWGMFGM